MQLMLGKVSLLAVDYHIELSYPLIPAGYSGNLGNTIRGMNTVHRSEVRASDMDALRQLAVDGGSYHLHMRDHGKTVLFAFTSNQGQIELSSDFLASV
jgi:hypothetical protein